jgi:hypothetical protein
MQRWQCRTAPSLGGGFAGTPADVWGVRDYNNLYGDTVFFGMYGLPDFYAMWRHEGRKAILWAGSDITHFVNGYWLDDKGEIWLDNKGMAAYINRKCENYVENVVEALALEKVGIQAQVVPSFLGNVGDFELCYKPSNKPKYYTSVSGDDFELYGWDNIWKYAKKYPNVEFHLYGNRQEWKSYYENVIVHGRVSQEQMDSEIKEMQGALRLTEFDGFSEILAKSILWGQWPASLIRYPHMLDEPTPPKEANIEGREHYLEILNKYPWNHDKNNKPTEKILERTVN